MIHSQFFFVVDQDGSDDDNDDEEDQIRLLLLATELDMICTKLYSFTQKELLSTLTQDISN